MNENQDWMKQLEAEGALSMIDAHRLDQALDAQSSVVSAVQSLENDEPSLAWRSQLNERLHALSPVKPKRHWLKIASLTTAVSAAALAAFMVIPRGAYLAAPAISSGPSAEQILVDAHRGSVFALSTGASDGASPINPEVSAPAPQWTEAELEAF